MAAHTHVVLVGATRGVFATAELAAAAAAPSALPLIVTCASEDDARAALAVFADVDATRVVYVDGSSLRNGKPDAVAGFGVFYGEGDARNVSAAVRCLPRTNNVAELEAIECALQQETQAVATADPDVPAKPLVIVSDSSYSIRCLTSYFAAWVRSNWMTSARTPVKNAELIRGAQRLLQALPHVRLFHVRGHVGIPGNEGADALACAATAALPVNAVLPAVTAAAGGAGQAPSTLPATSGAGTKTRRPSKRPRPQ